MIRQALSVPGEIEPPTCRAGDRRRHPRVVYRRLRAGHPEEFADIGRGAAGVGACYQRPGRPPGSVASVRPETVTRRGRPAGRSDWDEPPDSPRSRAGFTQRERIVRAAAQIAAEIGYAALTIPAISARPGPRTRPSTSTSTSKDEAFIAAFEELSGGPAGAATSAGSRRWRPAVEAGPGACSSTAPSTTLREAGLLRAADRRDLDARPGRRGDRRFGAFLAAGGAAPGIAPASPVVVEAIGGGIWAVIQHEIAAGDLASAAAPGRARSPTSPWCRSGGDPPGLLAPRYGVSRISTSSASSEGRLGALHESRAPLTGRRRRRPGSARSARQVGGLRVVFAAGAQEQDDALDRGDMTLEDQWAGARRLDREEPGPTAGFGDEVERRGGRCLDLGGQSARSPPLRLPSGARERRRRRRLRHWPLLGKYRWKAPGGRPASAQIALTVVFALPRSAATLVKASINRWRWSSRRSRWSRATAAQHTRAQGVVSRRVHTGPALLSRWRPGALRCSRDTA